MNTSCEQLHFFLYKQKRINVNHFFLIKVCVCLCVCVFKDTVTLDNTVMLIIGG